MQTKLKKIINLKRNIVRAWFFQYENPRIKKSREVGQDLFDKNENRPHAITSRKNTFFIP